MCEQELTTSSLSKVIVQQTDTHPYIHRDMTEIIYHSASRVVKKNFTTLRGDPWSFRTTIGLINYQVKQKMERVE